MTKIKDSGQLFKHEIIPTYEEFSDNQKPDLILVFSVGVEGLTRQQTQEHMIELMSYYKNEQFNNFNIHQYWFPVDEGRGCKLEVINPSLSNKDIITQLKDLTNAIETPEYIGLISQLKSFEKIKDTEQELRTIEMGQLNRKLKKIIKK